MVTFRNYSKHVQVTATINSGLPPSKENTVHRFGFVDEGQAKQGDIPQGPWYYLVTWNSNIGPPPAGTLIGQTGGVYAGSTVTLSENDALVIT